MNNHCLRIPELSKNNPYWIEKHRYYELKHFCLQYRFWKIERARIEERLVKDIGKPISINSGNIGNPTANVAEARIYYTNRIEMIERVAKETDSIIGKYILIGVTEGISYEIINSRMAVPCGKDMYYNLYRRFFWLLSNERQ